MLKPRLLYEELAVLVQYQSTKATATQIFAHRPSFIALGKNIEELASLVFIHSKFHSTGPPTPELLENHIVQCTHSKTHS